MLPTRLLTTTLALTLLATAYANDSDSRAWTLACSAALPLAGACYVETPLWVLADFELALGIDARARSGDASVGAYLVAALYRPTWSVWSEVSIPSIPGLPVGRPEWFRVGFTVRLQ
jgi:hypothetical protein